MTNCDRIAAEGKRRIDADTWKYPKRKLSKHERENNVKIVCNQTAN
jgi:hypothetical protein